MGGLPPFGSGCGRSLLPCLLVNHPVSCPFEPGMELLGAEFYLLQAAEGKTRGLREGVSEGSRAGLPKPP